MKLTHLHSLNEMAAKQTCGNCGQPMAGNHFYRKVGGVNKRFCKGSAIKAAVAQGLTPAGNESFIGQPPAAGAAPAATPAAATPPAQSTQTPATGTATPPPAAPKPAPRTEPHKESFEKQAKNWLAKFGIDEDDVTVEDGKINVDNDVFLDEFLGSMLPAQFGTIHGDFSCSGSNITTMKHFPEVIKGDLYCTDTKVKNWDDVETMFVEEDIHFTGNGDMETFKGIHKKLKMGGGELDLSNTSLPSNCLGLILIKGLNQVKPETTKHFKILNKHLSSGRDILEAQEELIDAGFGGLARM